MEDFTQQIAKSALADLRGGGETRPADRPARRQHVPLCADVGRLAVVLPARLCRAVQHVRGPVTQPDLQRRVQQVPGTARCADQSGVTWLPGFLWRAVKTWRGVRAEVPWVKRSPAETIRENVRLTVQPIDAPRDTPVIERIIEQIDSDRMLLFASDYPHWQFEGDQVLPDGLSADLLQRIAR